MYQEETIIAPATGHQSAAIAVIRVSGPASIKITKKVFKSKFKKNLKNQKSHTLHFGEIVDGAEIIDEVLVAVFERGKSFTGEETVEISCHGSVYIQDRIIDLFLEHGARLAEPGEFSMRAFKNGQFDLMQAEAIADLIASDSKASHDIAMTQMRGGISSKLDNLRKELIRFTALLELELDFSEEDVEFADRTEFIKLLNDIQAQVRSLIDSFSYGNAIKNGVPVAIVGKPNAGKSTLLNKLLNEERAIVSNIAGTTRDTIEEILNIGGIKFRFIDTAGLRDTEDEIEKIGVQRALEKAKQAKVILYLFNLEENTVAEITTHVEEFQREDVHLILLHNKADEFSEDKIADFNKQLSAKTGHEIFNISAKQGDNVEEVKSHMLSIIKPDGFDNELIISNKRHATALKKALEALENAATGFSMNIPSDLIAQDLREAIRQLGNITGEIDVDRDILGLIFGEFCIGK
ncbi:tRNA uridine-5-carboxymethylaminomethyl(34) synthesis GTPase MnmE [Flavobacteriaceae bacterium Ap0902]|nr:tRNA uridine-5-carboxymethylaminomethyl(34) synthesis GTPase MnmE [Flavobacteriaceae bacterium Ap0902]